MPSWRTACIVARHLAGRIDLRMFARQSNKRQRYRYPIKLQVCWRKSTPRATVKRLSLVNSSKSPPSNAATAMMILGYATSSSKGKPPLSASQSFPRLSSAPRLHATKFVKISVSVDPTSQPRQLNRASFSFHLSLHRIERIPAEYSEPRA
jgi:hypothetical protein